MNSMAQSTLYGTAALAQSTLYGTEALAQSTLYGTEALAQSTRYGTEASNSGLPTCGSLLLSAVNELKKMNPT